MIKAKNKNKTNYKMKLLLLLENSPKTLNGGLELDLEI